MGQSISSAKRLEIVIARRNEKLSYRALAKRHQVHFHSVRRICLAYEQKAEGALVANYAACGRSVGAEQEKVYRLVRLIRHLHPGWGVPYILTRIRVAYPDLALQSDRHYQRRLKKDGPLMSLPPGRIPREPIINDVRQAHDEWQIDAKEQLELDSGQDYSYLNITDAKTNALLKTKSFPPQGDPST